MSKKFYVLCVFDVDFGVGISGDGIEGFGGKNESGRAWISSTEINNLGNNGVSSAWPFRAAYAPQLVSPTTGCSIVPQPIAHRCKISTLWELALVASLASCCYMSIHLIIIKEWCLYIL